MTFETKIWNKRKEQVQLYETDGKVIMALSPGEISNLESAHDRTIIAPYSEVIFEKDGSVFLLMRDKWIDPYDKAPWRVEIVNLDGRPLEPREIGGELIFLQRGIPVVRFLESGDPLAEFERIEIRRGQKRQKVEDWPGYYAWVGVLEDTPTLRDQKDLDQIKKDREALAEKQAATDTAKE